jgi:D-alanyl-D-alanine dipeptidase
MTGPRYRTAELPNGARSGERQGSRLQRMAARRLNRQMIQQLRLAHARLAVHDQHLALTRPYRPDSPVEQALNSPIGPFSRAARPQAEICVIYPHRDRNSGIHWSRFGAAVRPSGPNLMS